MGVMLCEKGLNYSFKLTLNFVSTYKIGMVRIGSTDFVNNYELRIIVERMIKQHSSFVVFWMVLKGWISGMPGG